MFRRYVQNFHTVVVTSCNVHKLILPCLVPCLGAVGFLMLEKACTPYESMHIHISLNIHDLKIIE